MFKSLHKRIKDPSKAVIVSRGVCPGCDRLRDASFRSKLLRVVELPAPLWGISVRWQLRDPGVLREISVDVMVGLLKTHFLSLTFP